MKITSVRALTLALLASFALAASSSAATILQFGQTNPNDVVTGTAAGAVTTLTTNSVIAPGSIPVLITNVGGTPLGTPLPAFETFINLSSIAAATAGGTVEQRYNGTIAITSGPNNTGGNFLTATFSNAVLTGLSGGGALSLLDSRPPESVTFTSNFAPIIPLIAGNPPENFSIAFSNVTPALSVSGSTIASFTAQNAGTFSTSPVIPEPASIGLIAAGGLVLLARRRR